MTVRRVALFVLLSLTVAAVANDFLVSESAYRTLSKAEGQLQQQQYARALEILDRALDKRGLSDYERALFERFAGVAFIGAGNHAAAAKRFETVLASAALPAAVLDQVRYKLAQLYLHEARYDDALALLKPWMDEAAQPAAKVCFLIASAYAALERLPTALEWGERGLAQADAPVERQYAFVAGLNLTLERYPRAAELLERLIEHYPQTAQHWRRLSAVYSELERDERALAVAELGYLQGVLVSDRDVDRLARLYLWRELPYKAAVLLDGALQTAADFDAARYRLLANAWIAAREHARALAPLEKAASRLHADGEPDKEAEVRLLKGIVHTHLEQYDKAAHEFEHCLKFEKTRTAAGEWLAYLKV